MSVRKQAMRDIRRAQDARLGVSSAEASSLISRAEVLMPAVRDAAWAASLLAHCRAEFACGNYEQAANEARELIAELQECG